MAPTTQEQRTVTGVDGAYVNTITKVRDKEMITQGYVARGEALPKNLAEGELERLEELGAFEPQTHRERAADARANRNRLRGANVATTRARQAGDVVNNPKTPDLTAPPPGSAMAPPMTQEEAAAYEGGDTAQAATPPPDEEEQGISLEDYGKDELLEMAAERDIAGRSSMNKPDLVKAIQEHDAAAE